MKKTVRWWVLGVQTKRWLVEGRGGVFRKTAKKEEASRYSTATDARKAWRRAKEKFEGVKVEALSLPVQGRRWALKVCDETGGWFLLGGLGVEDARTFQLHLATKFLDERVARGWAEKVGGEVVDVTYLVGGVEGPIRERSEKTDTPRRAPRKVELWGLKGPLGWATEVVSGNTLKWKFTKDVRGATTYGSHDEAIKARVRMAESGPDWGDAITLERIRVPAKPEEYYVIGKGLMPNRVYLSSLPTTDPPRWVKFYQHAIHYQTESDASFVLRMNLPDDPEAQVEHVRVIPTVHFWRGGATHGEKVECGALEKDVEHTEDLGAVTCVQCRGNARMPAPKKQPEFPPPRLDEGYCVTRAGGAGGRGIIESMTGGPKGTPVMVRWLKQLSYPSPDDSIGYHREEELERVWLTAEVVPDEELVQSVHTTLGCVELHDLGHDPKVAVPKSVIAGLETLVKLARTFREKDQGPLGAALADGAVTKAIVWVDGIARLHGPPKKKRSCKECGKRFTPRGEKKLCREHELEEALALNERLREEVEALKERVVELDERLHDAGRSA